MQASPVLCLSPSFNAYTSHRIAVGEIAARVVEEEEEEYDDGFEFSFVCKETEAASPISAADELFCNGQIRPLFNTNLLLHQHPTKTKTNPTEYSDADSALAKPTTQSHSHRRLRPQLRKLMSEGREPDELHGALKSHSSKRWKLRQLLYRKNTVTDGKNTFVFLPPSRSNRDKTTKSDFNTRPYSYSLDLVAIFSNVNGFTRNLHPF